jgi:hypothetical protein
MPFRDQGIETIQLYDLATGEESLRLEPGENGVFTRREAPLDRVQPRRRNRLECRPLTPK